MKIKANGYSNVADRRINIFLAAPCPPPDGGITNWQRIVKQKLIDDESVHLKLIDTSLKKEPHKRGLIYSAKGVISILVNAMHTINGADDLFCRCSAIHICTSGGFGFLRDIGLVKIAHSRGIPAMLHLHFGRVPDLLVRECFESKLLKYVLKSVDGIMSMDEKTRGALCTYGYGEKTYLVPNPIEDELFGKNSPEKSNEVVFVGHVLRTKGIEELISAWNLINDKSNDFKLKIIGPVESEYKKYLDSIIVSNDIEFCGPMKHKETLDRISHARVLVLPSYTEGFPNVVLEAMAVGTFVIATPVGSIPEMLANGRGAIVPVKDVDSLANELLSAIQNEELTSVAVEKAHLFAQASYSSSSVIEKMKRSWRKMIFNEIGEAV